MDAKTFGIESPLISGKGYDWVPRQVERPRRWLACLVIGWSCARKGQWGIVSSSSV